MSNYKEKLNSEYDAIQSGIKSNQAALWTALPGIVRCFNAVAVTAEVQPAIMGIVSEPNGSNRPVKLPLLLDCPVVFPRGGGCTLTFPVKPGDECLVIFSSRCIDAWWQSGGVQIPMEMRMHDLSDGFVLVGPMSQAQKIGNISTTAVQLRSDDGIAFVEIDPYSKNVRLKTSTLVAIEAPNIHLTGNVTVTGTVTQGGGDTAMTGNVSVNGDVSANGISLTQHKHGGVQSGGSTTSTPV